MTGAAPGLTGVRGVTLDFGNTLVRVDRAGLHDVLATTAEALLRRGTIAEAGAFRDAWATERDRQFRLRVPKLLEVDLAERVRHVLGALRGASAPATDNEPWDEGAVSGRVNDDEVGFAVEAYSRAFVERMPALPGTEQVLRELAGRDLRLGVLSNWPLAATIDRYVEARGWRPLFEAVVVSQRVGVIKPHRAIFAAASEALGLPASELLHVGDDWAADVVGAKRAGWRAAYLRGHQGDTPLPTSERDGEVAPDIEIDRLDELLGHLGAVAAS